MTLVSRTCVTAGSVVLVALMALPVCAQARHRAVAPAVKVGPTIQVAGLATDASNGVPIEDAVVTAGAQTTKTNPKGEFTLYLPSGISTSVSVEHPAFNPATRTITAQSGVPNLFSLVEKASVTIRTKTGEIHIVDIGTAQFAYAVPFSGYQRNDNANFCKADGTDFAPAKTDFSKILDPAAAATTPCCVSTSAVSANVEMKSGEKLLVYFKDSCSHDEVDFVGREKATGHYQYFNFNTIAEIDFP